MFIKYFISVLIILFSGSSFALNEATVLEDMKNIITNGRTCKTVRTHENFWKIKRVTTQVHLKYWKKGDYDLHFSKFGCGIGKYGSIVIAPGRTESSVEFYETAIDFVEKGFAPVYVVDHVSQGFSPRLLSDHHKGHINRFSDYVNAFDSAVKAIEMDLKKTEGRKDQPLFFTSNSMGGAIGIGYFQKKGERNPFKAAALVSAMIKVNYLGFPGVNADQPNGITHPTGKEKLLYSELGVIAQARVFCKTKGCDEYATKGAQETAAKHGTSYVEGRRNFVEAWAKAPEQVMTHSRARYDLRTFLWDSKKMKAMYKRAGLTNPQLGAPTYQWAKQTAKFNMNMRAENSIEKMSKMPLKVITGTNDVRAYTPHSDGSTDLEEHRKFCRRVNEVKGEGVCNFLPIDGAFHEIYKESRQYRRQGMDAVVNHFLDSL